MNIDGATAVIFCELGFPLLCLGTFLSTRSVGILAHGWEQIQQGAEIKGPSRQIICQNMKMDNSKVAKY